MKYPEDYINKIINGDCMDIMADIPTGSIDMILCDPPFALTKLQWDKLLDLKNLFGQYKRIIKAKGVIILFGQQPFTTDLINAGRDIFHYEMIFEYTMASRFLDAKKRPLLSHSNILVFYKNQSIYNPQKYYVGTSSLRKSGNKGERSGHYGRYKDLPGKGTDDGFRYPRTVLKFSNWNGVQFGNKDKYIAHPTAKPVALFEYLIKTYTNEGELVLDNCRGSGTTALAARNTKRNFIGIELNGEYVKLANSRIADQ
jgi:site-specific DNA-methyltransferase (adenine-specific)